MTLALKPKENVFHGEVQPCHYQRGSIASYAGAGIARAQMSVRLSYSDIV